MSKHKKLNNPPIKEAVIDFQFQPYLNINNDLFEQLKLILSENYSKSEFIYSKTFSFYLDNVNFQNINKNENPDIVGIRFFDNERNFIISLFKDRITISKLPDYHSFEELKCESGLFFNLFQNLLSCININRIGVKYINEIKFKNNINKILKNKFSPVFENTNKYSMQYIVDNDDNIGSIINITIDNPAQLILIDIDCYENKIINIDDFTPFSNILLNLRKIKNEEFFKIVKSKFEENNNVN